MVIFLNMDGSAENVSPQHVYQGSNNVTDVTVVAPLSAYTAMQIGFILPNGLYWESPSDGARYAPMEFVELEEQYRLGVWRYILPQSVTEQNGDLQIAINAITANGNTTSYLCKQTIQESVLPNLPEENPEPSVYALLQLYISRLDGRTANVPYLVASIKQTARNAFTFTRNNGLVGGPIIFGDPHQPEIPANAGYVTSIIEGEYPEGSWEKQSNGKYTCIIDADTHTQIYEGVSAADLWVSLSTVSGDTYTGVTGDYTVNSNGDITLTATNPVGMVVRVWNGKGLVDNVARDEITEETQRAKTAEANLQMQIDHIVDTGIDKQARADIAAETERAEAAEQSLQNAINTNASDIAGLREDMTNADHFKGVFNTVEELKATTATPQDFAYIAGGNIWTWQNGEWTDSEKPVPDSLVPASTSVPLMDGTGSAGTSNDYARGNHRHPTDTNLQNAINGKVSKTGDIMTGKLTIRNSGGNFQTAQNEAIEAQVHDQNANNITLLTDSADSNPIREVISFGATSGMASIEYYKIGRIVIDGEKYIVIGNAQMVSQNIALDILRNNCILINQSGELLIKGNKALTESGGIMTGSLNITGTDEGGWSLKADGDIGGNRVYEGENRVYSPNNPPPIQSGVVTGTLNGTTLELTIH